MRVLFAVMWLPMPSDCSAFDGWMSRPQKATQQGMKAAIVMGQPTTRVLPPPRHALLPPRRRSDAEEQRASATIARLKTNAEFRADLAAAAREITAARRAGPRGKRDSEKEADRLARNGA